MQTEVKYDMCECGRGPATEKYMVGGTAEGNVFEYWCSSCISEDPTDSDSEQEDETRAPAAGNRFDSAAAGSSALRAPKGGADKRWKLPTKSCTTCAEWGHTPLDYDSDGCTNCEDDDSDSDSVITVEDNRDIPSGYYEGTGWLDVQKMYKNGNVSKQFNKFYTKPEFDSVKYTGKNQVVYIQCDDNIGYFVVSKFGDMGDVCRRDIYSAKEEAGGSYKIVRIANASHFNFITHRGRAFECRLVCSR